MSQLMEKQLTEQPVEMTAPVQVVPRRPRWMFPVVAVVALMLGGLGGWLLARATDDDTKPTTVAAGNVALTDRQQEMVRTADEYIAAWQANDAAAVLALYTSYGEFQVAGSTYRVDDGTLEALIESDNWSTLTTVGPTMVVRNQVVRVVQGSTAMSISVLTFNQVSNAAPLIMTHEIIGY